MSQPNPTRRLRQDRAGVLAILTIAGFGLIVLGLIRLQVTFHDRYRDLSQENHVRLEVLQAPRGAIYDRHGVLLADSAPSFRIAFRPFPAESVAMARVTLGTEWITRVATLLGLDTVFVRQQVHQANSTGQTAILMHNAPFALRAAVEETRGEMPGLEVQTEPLRHYPYGILAAHLLGYAGEVNEQELEQGAASGYRPGDLIGRTGVERAYEDILRGRDGAEFVVVNAMGKRVSTLTEGPPRNPTPGHDLVLTLDMKVQQAMEDAMAGVDRGAAVALDPRDGSVLGLVSRPAFDPNEFSIGLTYERWQELSNGDANPLLNRALQGVYPPGSTFKVVSTLAALREGIATPATRLQPCYGHYLFGGRSFGCWQKEGHGSLNLIEAIQHSCDVYFYQLGPRIGLPHLEAAARDFGLGSRTGIDLPQEKKGLVPSPAWYDARWGPGRWRKGLLLNLVIGQGELLVTPLQLAVMMAETATDGAVLRPHVVQEIKGVPDFVPPRPSHEHIWAHPEDWAALKQGLELVVQAGTATAARVPGVRVAGKTGTAQNPHGKDHALFACFAPVEHPTIALAFVVENSGHGSTFAAPKAGAVLSKLMLPDSVYARLHHLPAVHVAAPDTAEAQRGD